jgi:hypothetical protein
MLRFVVSMEIRVQFKIRLRFSFRFRGSIHSRVVVGDMIRLRLD